MGIEDISPDRSYIALPGVQRYQRASDDLWVTEALGTRGVTECLLGSDGSTTAEFPSVAELRGFSCDGGDQLDAGAVASFAGGGGADQPFSVAALVQYTSDSGLVDIVRKGDTINVDLEWRFFIDSDDADQFVAFTAVGPSGGAVIGRQAPLRRGVLTPIVATYSASLTVGGFAIYDESGQIDDGDYSAGAYSGMSDLGGSLSYFNSLAGLVVCPMVFDRELSASEATELAWRLRYLYGITP